MKSKAGCTYIVSGKDGQDMGPLSLQEVKKLAKAGTISGETFVRRSDSEHWSTACHYEELGLKDVVVTPYDSEGGPDALTQEAEKFSHLRKVRLGGSWFFWIAGLSSINALAAWAGSIWGYALGLSTCYVIGGAGEAFGAHGRIIALAINLAVCVLFLAFGVAAWYGRFTPYAIGMLIYAADTLLPVISQDWISIGIHGLALWCLFSGFRALMDAHNKTWDTKMYVKAAVCLVVLMGLGGALVFSMRVAAKEIAAKSEPASSATTAER